MTIKECIDIVDNIKPNQYTVADKINWLTFVDMTIINDVLKTHEGYDGRYDLFEGYSPDKLTASLVVPTPYDRLYTAYLSMQIDRLNGETAKYNNSASLYNTYLLEYKRYYNKTHMPLDITRKGYREKPPKKHTVGLTAAEYESLKRDLYFALSADVNEVISPDKLYDIVTSYAYNNIEMLKGADGKTPVRGVDYYTEEDVDAMVEEVQKVQNENLAKAYADIAKNSENLRLHVGNKDNPHDVTAEQVGAYTKEEVDKMLENIDVDVDLSDYVKNTDYATSSKGGVVKTSSYFGTLANADGYLYLMQATDAEIDAKEQRYHIITPNNLEYAVAKGGEGHFAKEDAVFEKGSFAWTDFEYTLPSSPDALCSVVDDKIFIGGTGEPVIIHCAGKTLGFTFSISGYGDAEIKINGETTVYTDPYNDGREFASDVVIPLTYMESDIVFSGGMKTWTFTDMTIQSIKGIGNIDKALDTILAIQDELIGGDA